MSSAPELSYDIYYWIIQAVGDASTDGARDKICAKTLLSCCLVNHAWRQLAQPLLNQIVVIENDDDLNRRILARSSDHHLSGLRNIVFRESSDGHYTFNLDTILRVLPKSNLLRSFTCYDGGRLPESSDEMDRELIGTPRFPPSPLSLDLSGLREALLGSIPFGPSWVPLLLVAPNLRHLRFHCCGWFVNFFISFPLCG
jgi:hypothetical protein